MTVSEFSNEFDILYNNINSNIAPGLNEYEKSVLLTEAQENLIKSLYNGYNVYQDSFEESEEIRSYLSGLVKTAELFPDATYTGLKLIDSSVVVKKPTDVWFLTFESSKLRLSESTVVNALVIPTKQDSLFKILNNPFKRPDRKRVLRLDNDKDYIELIYNSDYTIVSYLIRYIVQPKPIILCDLDNATINGLSVKTECELHPSIHRLILEKAVILAKSTYIPNN